MLTSEQKKICDLRLKEHMHQDYIIDLTLNKRLTLKKFLVQTDVFRPETTSGFYLARYLSCHPHIYKHKEVLDLCCGSGIQGIVMGVCGAKKICFSDISKKAVANTKKNVGNYGLKGKSFVTCGDLFKKINSAFDLIVCNHPFFDSKPLKNVPITRAWFDDGTLINKFLKQAPKYLKPNGVILMPFFALAGNTNDPNLQAIKRGYRVEMVHKESISDTNIQKGMFYIYKINIT